MSTIFRFFRFTLPTILALIVQLQAKADIYRTTLMEPNQSTAEVSTEELRQILATASAVVFDARPYEEYAISHIPGAINVAPKEGVPMSQYVSDVAEIGRLLGGNRQQSIILYCNGPFCGKSKRLGSELIAAGYTGVRRYQLGMPIWRALVGVAQIEASAIRDVFRQDHTAWFVDARPVQSGGTFPRAKHIPLAEVNAAKDDGRLPMHDHNTRLVVFGASGTEAQAVAASIAKNAFSNVTFFDGTFEELRLVFVHVQPPDRYARNQQP